MVGEALLSDAQLESVIYAGEAHTHHLAGRWKVNESFDVLTTAAAEDASAVRFRRAWFLGDGTGAGKGRQVAGILLDNWLKGRRRAVWVSKSDKLIEDAQRDWTALGQEKLRIVPRSRFRQGTPIRLSEGILFTTYATLRSVEREGKASRLTQIIDWLTAGSGPETGFDSVIVSDESHAMANAAGDKTERGERAASQQGLAGLRLQHAMPDARIVYVSATGATTVENLAYAQRLGLWGADAGAEASDSAAERAGETLAHGDAAAPFASRTQFVAAMQQGGIAAMEVLARDLKALGLYASRSLSYEGVEVEMLEHRLTAEQVRIYDAYAGAFQIIHQNLDAGLKVVNITGEQGTLNRQAKAAAHSAFESNKQRFFNHLITAMKCPTLIRAIDADRAEGRAAVVQLVSTSEALMERRLAHIPAGEWGLILPEFVDAFTFRDTPLTVGEAWAALNKGRCLPLAGGLALRRVMVMHATRIELTGFGADDVPNLKATDLTGEIISWKLRLFLPMSEDGPRILRKLLAVHPVIGSSPTP